MAATGAASYRIERWKSSRFWSLSDAGGKLVCVCVYKKGATEVKRILEAMTAREEGAAYAAENDALRLNALRQKMRERGERAETFTFHHGGLVYRWDVSAAWRVLSQRPRESEVFRPAEQEVDIHHVLDRYRDMDIEYALTTDLSLPLLFVPFCGRHQLIDGWHRLAKALIEEETLGAAELPAFVLTEDEAASVLLSVRNDEAKIEATETVKETVKEAVKEAACAPAD